MKTQTEAFSRGYSTGNYASAYVTDDWDTWVCANEECYSSKEWQEGALLGFFSSFEISEISDDQLARDLHDLRAEYGWKVSDR